MPSRTIDARPQPAAPRSRRPVGGERPDPRTPSAPGERARPVDGAIPARFYSLDVLRGCAALAVVLFHWQHFFYQGTSLPPFPAARQPFFALLKPFYVGGGRAVELFFSLSGFICFWLYADSVARRRTTATGVAVLRLSRLYPRLTRLRDTATRTRAPGLRTSGPRTPTTRAAGAPSANWGPLPLWDSDAAFQELRHEMEGHTLSSIVDTYVLYGLARCLRSLPGAVAEVGVYKGGTARMLANVYASTGKTIHLFDTFTGLPPTDPARDWHREGDFGDAGAAEVRAYLGDCPGVRLYEGLFPTTAGPVEGETFCLVHVDVDIYSSVLDCCRFFYPRLVAGGVVFDDYGRESCPGAKTAVDEFFAGAPEQPVYVPTGQASAVKC